MNNEVCSYYGIRKRHIHYWILLQLHRSIARVRKPVPQFWALTGSAESTSSPLALPVFENTETNLTNFNWLACMLVLSSAFLRSRYKAIDFCLSLSNNSGHLVKDEKLFLPKSSGCDVAVCPAVAELVGVRYCCPQKIPQACRAIQLIVVREGVNDVVATSVSLFTGMHTLVWQSACIASTRKRRGLASFKRPLPLLWQNSA